VINARRSFNLDILLSTLTNFEPDRANSLPRPHHKSFADLEKSAEAGCAICRLVCTSARYTSCSGTLAEGQISFRLNHSDFLIFDFDKTNDIDPASLHSLNWGMGFGAIRLSAIEGSWNSP
jgi:hypothetical protein